MSIASELLDRLERHYVKPSAPLPGGVFVREVGLNNNGGVQRRVDALYVGFTSASGQRLVGHEVKISRADWRHEIDDPEKSRLWSDACHEWYVVAPSTAVVPVEEVPTDWGLMVPNSRTTTRMQIVKRSASKPQTHAPSWMIMRSIIARQDTLRARQVSDEIRRQRDQMYAEHEQRTRKAYEQTNPQARQDRDAVEQLERALGVKIGSYSWEDQVSAADVAAALEIVRKRDVLVRTLVGYDGAITTARAAADQLEELLKVVQAS